MDRNMDKRPQSAEEFAQELRKALGKPFVAPAPLPVAGPPAENKPNQAPPQPQPYRPLQSPASPPPTQQSIFLDPRNSASPSAAPLAQPASSGSGPAGQSVFLDPAPATGPTNPPGQSIFINPTAVPQIPAEHRPFAPPPGRVCPRCGHTNKPDARFCGTCGLALAGEVPARLIVLGSGGAVMFEQTLATDMTRFTIGRRSPSRNIFPDPILTYMDPRAVSRQHAEIRREDGAYTLVDLGSENGTYINETRLRANVAYALHNGDIIRVGRVQLRFSLAVEQNCPQPHPNLQSTSCKLQAAIRIEEEREYELAHPASPEANCLYHRYAGRAATGHHPEYAPRCGTDSPDHPDRHYGSD